MHLISALAAGVAGGELGTARAFLRGTVTRAALFTDFEGTVSTSQDLTLDSDGRVIVYANTMCDVVVLDADGAEVTRWVEAVASPNVEVISPSFTGTSYVDASGATISGASQPTTLQRVLDLFLAAFGSTDLRWLDSEGDPRSLVDALQAFDGVMRNVRDERFNATGNGVNDDLAAVQAAIDVGPGIVFFPEGTYRTTASLIVPNMVSLVGAGAVVAEIRNDNSGRVITVTGGSDDDRRPTVIRGLSVTNGVTNTADVVAIFNQANVIIEDCSLGDASFSVGSIVSVVVGSDPIHTVLRNCHFRRGPTGATPMVIHTNAAGTMLIDGCRFTPSAAYSSNLVQGTGIEVRSCYFELSACTSGAPIGFLVQDGLDARCSGCTFENGGGTSTPIAIETDGLSGTMQFLEWGNSFGSSNLQRYNVVGDEELVQLYSRDGDTVTISDGSATITLDGTSFPSTVDFGVFFITRPAAAGNLTLDTVATGIPTGHRLTVVIRNESGGTDTFAFGTGFNPSPAGDPFSIDNNDTGVFEFIGIESEWVQTSQPRLD